MGVANPLDARNLYLLILSVALSLSFVLSACVAEVSPDDNEPVWPISGTTNPDLPLSSTYGPRLQASEGYRYDFHRGIDIPAPLRSPVYAIADGDVRLAGDYSFYADILVQISHYKADKTSCADGGCYYSNYMHLSSVVVREGQAVSKGQLIGYSGASINGFSHLHFEIRNEGWYQQNTIHPLAILPYNDTTAPQVTITDVNIEDPTRPKVKVTVTSSPSELDLNRVEAFVYNNAGGELTLVDQADYDMVVWNQSYTPRDTPNIFMDNPNLNGVEVHPAKFNASSEIYKVDFSFVNLTGVPNADHLFIKVRASDIRGNFTEATYP